MTGGLLRHILHAGSFRNRNRSGKSLTKDAVLTHPSYAGRHEGETLLVLGNGPSLRTHRELLRAFIAEQQPIVLGANHIAPFIAPNYHAFTNRKRFWDYAGTVDRERSRLLLSPYFTDELVRSRWNGDFEYLQFVADHDAPFDIEDGIIATSCRTVSVLLIAVAIVMAARRILVAGLDGFPEGSQSGPRYHAGTRVLKASADVDDEVQEHTTRLLGEMQVYLRAQGRVPLALITPTVYTDHFSPELLGEASP